MRVCARVYISECVAFLFFSNYFMRKGICVMNITHTKFAIMYFSK